MTPVIDDEVEASLSFLSRSRRARWAKAALDGTLRVIVDVDVG
jgi:phosphoribosyl-AMP cyclohydrolase